MAWVSIQTLRRHHPDIKVSVWTDRATSRCLKSPSWRSFRECEIRVCDPEGETSMIRSRWIKTHLIQLMSTDFLFLDCDTLVLRSLQELLTLDADFAAAVDGNEPPRPLVERPLLCEFYEALGWPVGEIASYNSGVWLARSSRAVERLGEIWPRLWVEGIAKNPMDQPSFWSALFQAGIDVFALDPKWNALVVHNPKRMRGAHVAHFWRSLAVGGTLLEELVRSAERTGRVNWHAIDRATRIGSPWRRDADPWQYVKSGHYCRAAWRKLSRLVGYDSGRRLLTQGRM